MHPTSPPDSTDRSRHRRSCRQVFFVGFLPCVCWGWLLVSAGGCDRPADATRANVGSTTRLAVDTETKPVTAAANVSPIRLEPPSLDFGPIQKGSTAEATVRLINTSGRPLRILQAKTSCGCTVVDVPKDPFDPGESINVTVRFRPKGAIGVRINKSIRFVLEGDYDAVPLAVSAHIAEFVKVSPRYIDLAAAELAAVVISSTDGAAFRIVDVDPPVFLGEPARLPKLEHSVVISRQLWQLHGSAQHVELTIDHPRVSSVTLSIRGGKRTGRPQRPSLNRLGVDRALAETGTRTVQPRQQTTPSNRQGD